MYTIIGGDGKEYGPASIEQIRAWIAAGRADGNTQAKKAGTNEWKRLADTAEFQGKGDVTPPVIPEIVQAEKLDIGHCYERSWNLLRANFWPLVGVTTLISAISLGAWRAHWTTFALVLIFSSVIKGGLYHYFLRVARGQPAAVADAFAGFSIAFMPLVLAGVVAAALVSVGFFLLVLPGIYLAVSYIFVPILVIDQKMDFWTAMEVSRRAVTAQWWRVLGLVLIGVLFALLGCAILFVGILVTLPIIEGAIVYAYEDLFKK